MISSQNPIVVVDDSPDDLALTLTLLRKVGDVSRVAILDTAEAVIDFLSHTDRSSDDFPRALILDVKMPGMGGLEVLEWVRSHARFDEVAVVMWSSSEHPRDVERAAALGAQGYLGKYPPVGGVEAMFRAIAEFKNCRQEPRFLPIPGNLLVECEPAPRGA